MGNPSAYAGFFYIFLGYVKNEGAHYKANVPYWEAKMEHLGVKMRDSGAKT
jgi:hypothetical protein